MERYIEYDERMSGEYYDAFNNSSIMQSRMDFYGNKLGRKRVFTLYHTVTGADDDGRPNYEQTDIINMGDPFDENSATGSFRLTSYSDNEWVVYVFGYNTNIFSHNISFEGKHFWIGTLENTQLTNGLYTILVNDFNSLIKSGFYKNETDERLFKSNVFNRNYNLSVDEGTIYFKMNSLIGSNAMNIGKNNYAMRTQRIDNTQNKIFIAVKHGTVLFDKIPASQVTFNDWNDDKFIEIDTMEYGVIFSSPQYSSSLQRKYQLLNVLANTGSANWSSFIYDSNQYSNTFTFLNLNVPFTKSYVVGLEERQDLFLKVFNSYTQIASTPLIQSRNEIVFDYYDDPDSFHLGNTLNYASAYVTSDTVIPPTLKNAIYVKNTILILNPSSAIPSWKENFSHSFNSGGTIGSEVYDFFTNPDSGIKANLGAPNTNDTDATYYAPSQNFGPGALSNTVSLAFEFSPPLNGENIYLGLLNQVNPNVTTTSTFEPSNDFRVNLGTGQIEIEGQNVGTPLNFQEPAVIAVSLTYLPNGNVLLNVGTSEADMQTFTLQTMGALTDPRFFISGNNLTEGTLGTFKQIPIQALVGETNDIPNEIIYPSSDISNMGDIFNEASTTGSFTLSSNSLTEWSVLVLDTSFNVLAGQTLGQGVEMYLGVFHSSLLSNGISIVADTVFTSMNKSGVNFKFTPSFTQKMYKENVLARDLDMFITPTLYFKLTNATTSTCFSIGVDNYHCRNLKLLNSPNKFFFAVRKGSMTFTKVAASTLIKSGWDNATSVEVDATDYDVEFSDLAFANTSSTSNRIITQSNNLTDFGDMFFSSNTNTNTFTFWDANTLLLNYYVKNIGKTSGTLSKNGTILNIGNSLNTLVGPNYFFRYNPDHSSVLKKNVFLGSSQTQYVSCYLDSDITVTSNVRFSVVFKGKIYTLACSSITDNWPALTSNDFTGSGTVGSPITNALSVLDYNTKNSFNVSSSTSGTLYFPSVFVGSGSMINPATFCFEFSTTSDVLLGVMNRTLAYTEITNTFESSSTATINLTSGVCFINGVSTTKSFGNSSPRVFIVHCRKLNEGLLVSIGSSGENATQGTLIPNVSFDNVCLYVTGNSLVNGHIITLKRITLPGLTGYTDEVPTQPQLPQTSLPLNFSPVFTNHPTYSLNESYSLTSTDSNWRIVHWTHDYPMDAVSFGTYGSYSFQSYNNQTMNWYVGFTQTNMTTSSWPTSNTEYTLNDSQINTIFKSGLHYNGIDIRPMYVNGNTYGVPFTFSSPEKNLLINVMMKGQGNGTNNPRHEYYIGEDNLNQICVNSFATSTPTNYIYPVSFFMAVKNGAISCVRKSMRLGMKLSFNEGNEYGTNIVKALSLGSSYTPKFYKGIPDVLNKSMGFIIEGSFLLNGALNFSFVVNSNTLYNVSHDNIQSFRTNYISLGKYNKQAHFMSYTNDQNMGNLEMGVSNIDQFNSTVFYFSRNTTSVSFASYVSGYTGGASYTPYNSQSLAFPNITTDTSSLFAIISEKDLGGSLHRYYVQMGNLTEVRTLFFNTTFPLPDGMILPIISYNSYQNPDIHLTKFTSRNISKWKDNAYYTFDSGTSNSALNDYFRNNNQITARKLKFTKSHVGTSITIRSPVNFANTVFMQYELYSNADVYFGIITDSNNATFGNWEYSQTYTDPSTMIAYVNLNTGQAVVGPNTVPPLTFTFTPREIKVLAISFTKSSDTATFTAFNHLNAPAINKPVTTGGHGGPKGYRYVITCNNVTDDNIMIINNFTAS